MWKKIRSPLSFVSALATILIPRGCQALLEAALVLPHGDFAWDPNLATTPEEVVAAREIARSSRLAGAWLVDQIHPDLIFWSTPHGISLSRDFGIYLGSIRALGSARIGQDLILDKRQTQTYDIRIDNVYMDEDLSQNLLDHLLIQNISNITGLYLAPDPTVPIPLFWGEVIPMLLVPQRSSREVIGAMNQTRGNIIWSHPHRRYDHAIDMVEELLQVGAAIRNWMDGRFERMAVVISGDLAHTHRPDGPYGYAPEASLLDRALGDWVSSQSPCHPESVKALLETARSYQPQGQSCGFTGMVLLHGMLCGTPPPSSSSNSHSHDPYKPNSSMENRPRRGQSLRINKKDPVANLTSWSSTVLANRNVTYYGMMVAKFWKQDNHFGTLSSGS